MAERKISVTTKRRQALTRQLVLGLLEARKDTGKNAPGLLQKALDKIDQDMDSEDADLRHKAIDKLMKLLPFAIAKQSGPSVQVNVQNNRLEGGKNVSAAIETAKHYFERRHKLLDKKDPNFKSKPGTKKPEPAPLVFEEEDDEDIVEPDVSVGGEPLQTPSKEDE